MRPRFWTPAAVLLSAVAIAAIGVAAPAPPVSDPYGPLRLYDGRWRFEPKGGAALALDNHCARTGLFFVCEQVLDGKPAALVVFRPETPTDTGWTYASQVVLPSGAGSGRWGPLIIAGDQWIFGPAADDPLPQTRTLNHIVGPDHIHYETQTSADGKSWVTRSSGDEFRKP
jgi:hypothetical protein